VRRVSPRATSRDRAAGRGVGHVSR
jgi:hypothetical protein